MKQSTKNLLIAGLTLWSMGVYPYEMGDWEVHGTFSQGYINSQENNFIEDSEDGTFDFREYGLNATRLLGERVSIGAQVFGRKFGAVGDDDIYLDWLNLSFNVSENFGLRAGKLKIPYGFYGETRDIDSLRTQILLPQSVYNESYRASINTLRGVQAFGYFDTGDWGQFDYSVQFGQIDVNAGSGEFNRLVSLVSLESDTVNENGAGAAKLIWNTPVKGLRLGATISWSDLVVEGSVMGDLSLLGEYSADINDQRFIVASAEYTHDRFTVSTELLQSVLKADVNLDVPIIPTSQVETEVSSFYVNLDYRMTDSVTLAVGYSDLKLEQDIDTSFGSSSDSNPQEGIYFSLRYDYNANLVAKVEQHFSSGEGGLFLSENPGGIEDDWSMTLFKLSFLF